MKRVLHIDDDEQYYTLLTRMYKLMYKLKYIGPNEDSKNEEFNLEIISAMTIKTAKELLLQDGLFSHAIVDGNIEHQGDGLNMIKWLKENFPEMIIVAYSSDKEYLQQANEIADAVFEKTLGLEGTEKLIDFLLGN